MHLAIRQWSLGEGTRRGSSACGARGTWRMDAEPSRIVRERTGVSGGCLGPKPCVQKRTSGRRDVRQDAVSRLRIAGNVLRILSSGLSARESPGAIRPSRLSIVRHVLSIPGSQLGMGSSRLSMVWTGAWALASRRRTDASRLSIAPGEWPIACARFGSRRVRSRSRCVGSRSTRADRRAMEGGASRSDRRRHSRRVIEVPRPRTVRPSRRVKSANSVRSSLSELADPWRRTRARGSRVVAPPCWLAAPASRQRHFSRPLVAAARRE